MFGISETRRVFAEMDKAKAAGEQDVCFNEAAHRTGFRKCPCTCGGRTPANRETATDTPLWADHAPFLVRAIGTVDKFIDGLNARPQAVTAR